VNASADCPLRDPITGIGCCARAASGNAATAPPRRAMNSRRFQMIELHFVRAGS
jgi:hypothetical protein